jgi:SPP1 gp7 family putative phage head morphogenesis protein
MTDVGLLSDMRDAVDKAIAEGLTFQQFRASIEPTLVEKGWWGKAEMVDPLTQKKKLVQLGSPRRLQIIFRTNMQQAYAAGDWKQIEETADDAPYVMYDAIDDNRTRPLHRKWSGTILRYDDPWWNTHSPPCGYNCRCGKIQLSQQEIQSRGLSVAGAAPTDGDREYVNQRTGEVMRIPKGVDAGFGYKQGASTRQAALQAALDEKNREYRDGE